MKAWVIAVAAALALVASWGRAAEPVAFTDERGAQQTLADYRGRVVVLNLWATWCAPCVEEMPALDRLQAAVKEAAVLPVSVDRDPAAARAFFEKHGIRHLPVLSAKASAIFKAVGDNRLPVTIVFDAAGREVERHVGKREWDSPATVARLKALLEPS